MLKSVFPTSISRKHYRFLETINAFGKKKIKVNERERRQNFILVFVVFFHMIQVLGSSQATFLTTRQLMTCLSDALCVYRVYSNDVAALTELSIIPVHSYYSISSKSPFVFSFCFLEFNHLVRYFGSNKADDSIQLLLDD